MTTENTMRAIALRPGKKPEIIELPVEDPYHEDAIRDVLGGNYGAIELFALSGEISLYLLVNDLAATLGLPPNRRFPSPDDATIIYGAAMFIGAFNGGNEEKQGTITLPQELLEELVRQIDESFIPCRGDERPEPHETIYYEDDDQEKAYRWIEIDRPDVLESPIAAGRVTFYGKEEKHIMEAEGRFFRKTPVYLPGGSLD
ncbi:hypothetical protein TAMA11512_02190 [Selenomonas sp. TAMA-11512]|uniref:DUF3846 domain-containing protein n=1 Tax=Selenomonas sp. TAMA-11512 TaxID=3095337 RepID=UPI003087CFDE|nr:hypothetical protein TAMA11512_02190 [Selenomonas sp. TAMA-11512]